MVRLTLIGDTFSIRNELKADGFRWNPITKAWFKDFEDKAYAENLASAWEPNGVYGSVSEVKEKRYMVKEDWIFNLESMHDKCWCLQQDIREGKIELPFEVAGQTITCEEDLDDLIEEASILEWKAKSNRGVSGKEYGRIKDIVSWRVMARYTTCLASGMSEQEAGRCFEDL